MELWRAVEALRLKMEVWRVRRPVVADLHHLMRIRIRIRIEVKSWVWIRIKVMEFRTLPTPPTPNVSFRV